MLILIIVGASNWQNRWRLRYEEPVQTTTVEITDRGFLPRVIQIERGETVTFINTRGKPVWPASNPHPIHTNYSAFDPRMPVDQGATWSFTFNQDGEWWYHDHTFPSFTGRVIVGVKPSGVVKKRCDLVGDTDNAERRRCWDTRLLTAYEEGGVKRSLAELKVLYNEDPLFTAAGCHNQAHRIGDAFYEVFSQNPDPLSLHLPPETVYCGYGFYHGLFEHLFRDRPEPQLAREFCEQLTKKLSKTIPRIKLNCFHGIGHGFVREPHVGEAWGKPQEIVDQALSVCESVSVDRSEIQECMQGAFNVIADWMDRSEYGLSLDQEKPMWMCDAQESRERSLACYYEMSMHLESISGHDIKTIIEQFIIPIKDQDVANIVMNSVVAGQIQRSVTESNQSRFVDLCYSFPDYLHTSCLNGITGGLMAHGKPEEEYRKALVFCTHERLTSTHRDDCYRNIIRIFKETYTQRKVQRLCIKVPRQFKHYCRYEK